MAKKPTNEPPAGTPVEVESEGQSGGITAHTVRKTSNLTRGLHIDNVEHLTVFQFPDETRFVLSTATATDVKDAAFIDVRSGELTTTGSTEAISASANVSALSIFEVPGSTEMEIEFFNPLPEGEFDVSSSQNTPKFVVARVDNKSLRLKFIGDLPDKIGVRVDSKPTRKD